MSDAGIVIPVKIEGQGGVLTLEQLASKIREVGNAADGMGKKLSGQQGALGGLTKSVLGVVGAYVSFRAALGFVTSSLKAQSEQEAAINKMNLALANQGNLLEGTSKRLQEYAGALQDTTTFSDDAVEGAMATLASFGMNEEQIKKTTAAVVDFAAATGTDLTSAANLMGKAFVGNTAALSRYGITLEEGLSKSQKFDAVVEQLGTRFGGSAKAATETFSGAVAQLSNQWGEAQEAFGRFLAFLTGGTSSFSGLIDFVKRLAKFFGEDLIIALSEARARFAEFVAFLSEKLAGLFDVLAKLPDALGGARFRGIGDTLRDVAAGQRQLAVEQRAAGDAAVAAGGNFQKFTNGAKRGLSEVSEEAKKAAAEIAKLRAQFSGEALLADIEKFNKAIAGEELNRAIIERAQALAVEAEKLGVVATGLPGAFQQAAASLKNVKLPMPEIATELSPQSIKNIQQPFLDALNNLPIGQAGFKTRFADVVAQELENAAATAPKVEEEFVSLEDATESWGEAIQAASDVMEALGISADSTLGRILGSLGSISSGFSGLASGLKNLGVQGGSGFLGGLTSALGKAGVFGSIAASAIAIGSSLVKLFKGDPIKKAQKEAGKILGTGISRELAEEIKKNADKLGIAVKDAALLALPKAIEESGKSAASFAQQAGDLMAKVASGAIPAKEGVEAIGKTFALVSDEAIKAGRVGDATMRQMIRNAKQLGLEIPEIKDFIAGQLDTAVAGLDKFIKSLSAVSDEGFETLGADAATIFGATFAALVSERGVIGAVDALGESFSALKERLTDTLGAEQAALLLSPFSAAFDLLQNESLRPLVEGIDGLGQALTGLANSDFLDVNTFRAIERSAGTLFDELIAGGADTHTALLAIAPTIQAAITAAEQFGIPLGEDTERLKALAEQNGITFKTDPQQAMLDVLVSIAQVLGADIPASAQRAQQAMEDLASTTPTVPTVPEPGAPTGGVPTVPGAPGGGAPGGGGSVVQQVQNVINLSIEQNPFQTAEGMEATRKLILQTVDQAVDNLEVRLAE